MNYKSIELAPSVCTARRMPDFPAVAPEIVHAGRRHSEPQYAGR
jgi:hypothetical protein